MSTSKNHKITYGRVIIDPIRIKNVIAERRQLMGLSLRGLAKKADVSLGTVVALEQGKHNVQLEKLLQVLTVLDLVPQDLWETKSLDLSRESLLEEIQHVAEAKIPSEFLTRLAKTFKKKGF